MPDLRVYAREAAGRAGIDPDLFERQIQQESGFNPEAHNVSSGAHGIAQIVARFHPEVDPSDPIASLDYAAQWMGKMRRQYGTYRKALAAYNWGPGNVAGWDGRREGLPAETRHYLDVILGVAWAEPAGAGNGTATIPLNSGGGGGATGTGSSAVIQFRVARVSPDRLNVRAEPSRSAAVVETVPEGTLLVPLGPAREADGLTWLQARTPSGAQGWAATSFLDVVAAPPGDTAAGADGAQPTPTTPPVAPVDAQPTPSPAPPVGDLGGAAGGVVTRFRVREDGVRLRERPGTGDDVPILARLRSGTLVEDDGADLVNANGLEWRRVRVDGQTGWVATEYLSPAAGGRYEFDRDTPTELQVQNWTCSIRSTMWMLKSIGIPVTPAEAQDAMSPRYVNSDLGLLDASGAGIVEVLQETWGVTAFNRAPVTFDEVASWAGTYPMAIGGRNWGHWTAVRGFDGERLVLANPGGTGPRFGQQTLNRQQFVDLGWFSAVVIPVE